MLDEKKYGHGMKKRVCELALKLCNENDLMIFKAFDTPDQTNDLSQVVLLTCDEKLNYCQIALDNLQESRLDRDSKLQLSNNL